jgi:hypothetical protein
MNATAKQIEYIKSLQGKLGMSTYYVDLKGILGKVKIGYQLTQANASDLISKLLDRCQQEGK